MQVQSRRRLSPIIKRVVMAVAVKKGFDTFREMRQPQKPSMVGRIAKLGMWMAGGGGVLYALVSGKLQPVIDKLMGGRSSSSTSSESWSSSTPSSTTNLSSSPSPASTADVSGTSTTPGSFGSSPESTESPRL